MTVAEERLYHLLPGILRSRDVAEGEPLRALISVLEREFDGVEADIDDLYENWFIETCAEWVVPYIGDLLGVRVLHAVSPATSSARAAVANTIRYRRRKGTASMLEQLAHDVTGWGARAVEFFELLGWTQNVNHVRPRCVTADLRGASRLELLGGPFEDVSHTVEVRSIERRGGKYDIPNVGIFLWRLASYPLIGVDARAITEPSDGRLTFSPLGDDRPLFNGPRDEGEIAKLADEWDVPAPLRRRALHDDLVGPVGSRHYFAAGEAVLQVWADGKAKAPNAVVICDLTTWTRPSTGLVAVDPKLGRLAFPTGETPTVVLVDHAYGFPGDLGGGPYDRNASARAALHGEVDWQIGVSRDVPPVADVIVDTLGAAVQAWNALPPGKRGVIAILDSRTYDESLAIDVPTGSELLVVAADWPAAARDVGSFSAVDRRPHVRGTIEVRGVSVKGAVGGSLALNGLLVEGAVAVVAGDLRAFAVTHSTLAWTHGGLTVAADNAQLEISLDHALAPAVSLPASVPALTVIDSIVGDGTGLAIDAAGSHLDVQRSTVLGETTAKTLEAGNSLFTARVVATRRQTGCVRFCYVTPDSLTPRRFRCQPDLAVEGVDDPGAIERIRSRIVPSFSSAGVGDPAFAQLALTCPPELRTGAEDGSEMGAFSSLAQPQRETNLRASLPEYLRLGLAAGIFYVT